MNDDDQQETAPNDGRVDAAIEAYNQEINRGPAVFPGPGMDVDGRVLSNSGEEAGRATGIQLVVVFANGKLKQGYVSSDGFQEIK